MVFGIGFCLESENEMMEVTPKASIKLTAIVSVYNSSIFIQGCLENLTQQTLFLRSEMEIIVVNSGSEQNEAEVVALYHRKYPHLIKYIKTERETLYAAWNRGIELASGNYLTNANTDDRHRIDALEIMADALEQHPEVDLVYGDCFVSSIPNETFEQNSHQRLFRYPEYFPPAALLHYQFGPQPMWRRTVHNRIGFFDGSFRAAGDYDFNLRFAHAGLRALHVSLPLGLYLEVPTAISFRDNSMARENKHLVQAYQTIASIEACYQAIEIPCETPAQKTRVYLDMGCRALEYFPPWLTGGAEHNYLFAHACFMRAAELYPTCVAAINNLAVTLARAGCDEDAVKLLEAVPTGTANAVVAKNLTHMRTHGPAEKMLIIGSGLSLPTQQELAFGKSGSTVFGVTTTQAKALAPSHILLVSHGFPPEEVGGTQLYVASLAKQLHSLGHQVTVLVPKYRTEFPEGMIHERHERGIVVAEMTIHPFQDPLDRHQFEKQYRNMVVARSYRNYLSTIRPSLIHVHHLIGFSGAILRPAREVGIPQIVTLHDGWMICSRCHLIKPDGTWCEADPVSGGSCAECFQKSEYPVNAGFDLPGLFKDRMEYLKGELEYADAVTVPSRYLLELLTRHGLYHPRLTIHGLGLPVTVTKERQSAKAAAVRFAYIGHIIPVKGLDILFRAINSLIPLHFRLDIHGEVLDTVYFNAIAGELQPNTQVFCHGGFNLAELPAILAATDVVIIPSRTESFCFVARQCLQACIPVIAANVGALPEIIEHGINGLLFSGGDHEDLCAKMRFVMENPNCLDLFRAGIEPVTSIDEDAMETLAIYADCLARMKQKGDQNEQLVSAEPRLIAFHLPQFHAIPENDMWWGKGFTEWTNVTKALPRFPGHYQPHIPAESGYYDLADPETLKKQAQLAQEYGLHGFCFYHYWFNGKLLLETPLHQMLASGKPDFPFCLCWANENWTRAWDGQNNQILIGQKYSDEDDIRHFEYLLTFLRDSRYIRVQGKPLLLIYRANQLPDPEKTGRTWRRLAREAGIGDLYLCKVENFHDEHYDPRQIGFDASIEFQPDWSMLGSALTDPMYGSNRVYRYSDLVKIMLHKEQPDYTRFPCVTPSWDNSARRKEQATIFIEPNPAVYELWLAETIRRMEPVKTDENLIFINAWNEWGEGCHLEPDARFGRAFLEATRSAMQKRHCHKTPAMGDNRQERVPAQCCQVSIIIPVFNQVDFTKHCLETLYENTLQELAYEVVVVDNASTDGTADFLAEAINRYPNLRIVSNQSNMMFSGGCNSGARAAYGRHLLFLNNDTEPRPGWLEPLLEIANNDESVGIIGSKLLFMDETIQHAGIVVGMLDGEPYPYHVHFGEPATLADANQTCELQLVTGACLLIRTALFHQIGGYDEGFVNGHEDLDLCMKSRQAGFKVVYCPASAVIHFESRTKQLLGMDNFHYQQGVNNEEGRGRRRFLDRWGGHLTIDSYLPPVPYVPPRNMSWQPHTKTRVLLTMYGWNESGGGTIFPKSVAYELVKRGYEVAVFYASLKCDPLMPPYSLEVSHDDGVMLYGVYNRPALFTDPDHPQREIHDADVLSRFRHVLDEVSPDVIHFHNFHGLTFAIAEEAHRRGIPCCYTPHNYHLIDPDLYLFNSDLSLWRGTNLLTNSEAVERNPDKREAYGMRVDVTRLLLNEWIDLTLTVSSRQRELLAAHCGNTGRLAIVHQANASTDKLWNSEALQKKAHRPPHSPLQIGFIGGVMPQKGVHILVAAAQVFKQEEVQFHIHGFASTPEYFDQLLRLDRNNVVTFHGSYSQNQLPEIASSLDIAVVPSVWEDCAPLVVLELHAMRLPVIGAKIGGIPNFISDGIDGLLYRHDSLPELIAAIRRCIEQPELVMRMSRNLVAPTHNFKRYLDHLETVYAALLSGQTLDPAALSLVIEPRLAVAEETSPSVSWHGGLFVHHSLALVNRELCMKLLERGFDISFIPTQPDEFPSSLDPRFKNLEECRNKVLPDIDITIRHQWPPDFSHPGHGKLVLIQPWEFGSAPLEWVKQINANIDELWVPTSFVRDCYIQSGVEPHKVQVVPNGVAVECFHPAGQPCNLPTAKHFRFLFVGGTIHRKGIDVLLAAYSQVFTSNDDVCLVVKDMGGSGIYQGQTAQEMIDAFTKVPGHPEILHLQEDFDNAQMASLYTACHCLVHPYRGEGFGLPIAEAMACGLAPIVTGYGAALDFCPPEIAWLIPAEKHMLPEKKIGNLVTVDYPWLAEPDLDALASLMRHAFEHPDEVKQRGSAASCHIREHFTWDHAAQVAEQRLRLLAQKAEKGVASSKQSGNLMPQQEPVDNEAKESEVAMQNQLVQAACFKAEKLAQHGDVDAAVQVMLNEGIGSDADSPIPYLVLSGILMAAGRFEEVLGVAAEMPPTTDPCRIHEIEAQCFCALGDDAAARKAAMLAGEQSPLALVVLGTLSARQGNAAYGEQLFRQAIALDSGCAKAWLSLAMILWSQGKLSDAWEAVKQAVSIDPLNAEAVRIMRDMASRMV